MRTYFSQKRTKVVPTRSLNGFLAVLSLTEYFPFRLLDYQVTGACNDDIEAAARILVGMVCLLTSDSSAQSRYQLRASTIPSLLINNNINQTISVSSSNRLQFHCSSGSKSRNASTNRSVIVQTLQNGCTREEGKTIRSRCHEGIMVHPQIHTTDQDLS